MSKKLTTRHSVDHNGRASSAKGRKTPKPAEFSYALKSFVGHLEGTGKALHTIKNYRLDLLHFDRFLRTELGDKPVKLAEIGPADLDRFHQWMKGAGLKNNTRRRKLLTVQKFLHYLFARKRLPEGIARKVPTPHKIERVPLTVDFEDLMRRIRELPSSSVLEARNRLLLWTLLETGALVSEVATLRFDQWSLTAAGVLNIEIAGKNSRTLSVAAPVGRELWDSLETLRTLGNGRSSSVFQGFNKFGPLGGAITPRGVELLLKSYEARFSMNDLTPRAIRHTAVLRWHREGASQEEIQKRLGLKTRYAFRAYEALFRNQSQAGAQSRFDGAE